MLRRTCRRLGHQLIKEPMPNVEHDTTARGRATFANVKKTLEREMAILGAGSVLAAYTIYSAYATPLTTIKADGSIVGGSK